MAIQYTIYQDNRKNIGTKLHYGRAVHPTTLDTKAIAARVQRQCAMTIGDVQSVITNLVSVMTDELQNSNKVKLDGLGTFYISLKSVGALAEEDFNANEHIKGFRVNFLAEGTKSNGVVSRTFTSGLKAMKAVGSVK